MRAVVKALPWFAALLALAGVGMGVAILPVEEGIAWVTSSIAGLQAGGVVLFAILYVLVTLLVGPAWVLSVSAGIVYGFWGLALVIPVATIAATVAFLVARYLFRDRLSRHLEARPRLEAIDRAVRDHGFKTVLLLRLSPAIPFGAKSYLLGLSAVPTSSYIAGSAVGIAPGATIYVYLGSAGRLIAGDGLEGVEWALLGAGLAALAFLVVFIHREAERRLRGQDMVDEARR